MGFIINKLTKNKTKIPLLYITFDYKKYIEFGEVNSCTVNIHPVIKNRNDEVLKEKVNELIDYIRSNYNMNDM